MYSVHFFSTSFLFLTGLLNSNSFSCFIRISSFVPNINSGATHFDLVTTTQITEHEITAGHRTFSDHFKGMSNHFELMA